jgi:hypothetical protein
MIQILSDDYKTAIPAAAERDAHFSKASGLRAEP